MTRAHSLPIENARAVGWLSVALSAAMVLAACAGNGGEAASAPSAAGKVSVGGTVLYRERVALPPGSTVTVRVEDTALADAPAKLLAEQVIKPDGQVPIAFKLEVARTPADPRVRPSLRASIADADGRLLFTTTSHEAVDLSQDTRDRVLVLQRVAGGP